MQNLYAQTLVFLISVTTGRIQSVPVIGRHQTADTSREEFADSRVDNIISTRSHGYRPINSALPTHIHLPGTHCKQRAKITRPVVVT